MVTIWPSLKNTLKILFCTSKDGMALLQDMLKIPLLSCHIEDGVDISFFGQTPRDYILSDCPQTTQRRTVDK